MDKCGEIQINDTDYGDNRVVVERFDGRFWSVPAWYEMGLPELEGPFENRELALEAIKSVSIGSRLRPFS